jgi:hypothetical protein
MMSTAKAELSVPFHIVEVVASRKSTADLKN